MIKKLVIVGVAAVAVAVALWALWARDLPEAVPPPSSYVARDDTAAESYSAAADSEPDAGGEEAAAVPAAVPKTETGDIAGRIYDASTDDGIEGVLPELARADRESIGNAVAAMRRIPSDSSGRYRFEALEPGQYVLHVPKLEAYPQARSDENFFITVVANQTVQNVDFAMEPGAPVSGIVVSTAGEPVEGATVTGEVANPFEVFARKTTVSNADGSYELILPAGDGLFRLQAQKEDRISAPYDPLSLEFNGLHDVRLVLSERASGSISGFVVTSALRPVEGAAVSLSGQILPLGNDKPYVTVRTTSDGAFRVERLLAGDYEVYVTAPGNIVSQTGPVAPTGQPDGSPTVLHLQSGESVTGLRLSLGANLAISGRVVDDTGKAIPGITVRPDNARDKATNTGADGSFTLSGLEPGDYRLNVVRQGQVIKDGGWATAGTSGMEIVLAGASRDSRVDGQVVDAATGEPVTRFTVTFFPGGFSSFSELFFINRDQRNVFHPNGEFSGEVPGGLLNIVVTASGYAPANQIVEIQSHGSLTGVEVALQRSRKIAGRVIDTAGHGIANARVFWGAVPLNGMRSRVLAYSDTNGYFTVDNAPQDEDLLSALHPAYASGSATIAGNVEIVLEEGGVLEGHIMSPNGPIARSHVRVRPLSKSLRTFVDYVTPPSGTADGYYKIARIQPGDVEITATVPRGPSVSRTSRIEPGRVTQEDFLIELGAATVQGDISGANNPERVRVTLVVAGSNGEEQYWAQGRSDGTYIIAGVSSGSARLVAEGYGDDGGRRRVSAEFDVAPESTLAQNIDFGPSCVVNGAFIGVEPDRTGTVVALEGDVDLSGVATVEEVQAFLPTARAITVDKAECDASGYYELRALSPGIYTVVAVTAPAEDGENVAEWQWLVVPVTLEEPGESHTIDFNFK